MNSERTDVLVAGGGLVGLATALLLSWHGVSTVVVEKHRNGSTHPRARGINPRTMEILRGLGLESRLRDTPSARALAGNTGVIAVRTLAGPTIGELRQAYHADSGADYSDLTPTPWCLCHQDEVEQILREAAVGQGAQLRLGTELLAFQDDGSGVRATVRGDDGEQSTIDARYLVAADGVDSSIRSRLGIPFDGPGTFARFVNVRFQADLRDVLAGRRFIICYVTGAGPRCALLPIDNAEQWLLHVMTAPDQPALDPAAAVPLIRAATGIDDIDVRVVDIIPWDSTARTAGRFRQGRTFLVGDAAHVMPPSGAFGSNCGIQDAHNLAWKLRLVLSGAADPSLLDTYDSERRPVAEATVRQAVLRSKDRPRFLAADPDTVPAPPAGIEPDPVVIFHGRYGAGPGEVWAGTLDGTVGTRAPHLPVVRQGREMSTIDLYGAGPVLLAGPDGDPWLAAARQLAPAPGMQLAAYRVAAEDRTDPAALHDVTGRWAKAHGVEPDGAVLVRPDGYLAWRSTRLPTRPVDELTAALSRLLHRPLSG